MTDEPGLPSGGTTPSGADGEREQKRARTRFGIEVVVAALVVGGVAGGIAGNLTAGHEAAPSTVVTTLPAALNSTVAATTSTSATTTTSGTPVAAATTTVAPETLQQVIRRITLSVVDDGTTAAATLVGSDPDHDLAVLRIERTDLPSLTLGNELDLQVGDTVIAAGNALNLGGDPSITVGIISALGRTIDLDDHREHRVRGTRRRCRTDPAASRPTHPLT